MARLFHVMFAVPVLLLAACQEEEVAPEVIRPVLSVVAQETSPDQVDFTGTVEARYTTDLGFQVLGRIISREVDVGDRVEKGQLLATLDPKTFEFSVRAAEADLQSAQAQLTNARASELRFEALSKTGVSSESELDAAQQANESAEAAVSNAEAALQKAKEQLSYTRLVASFDGVVTATEAEVGQVVSGGETVMTVARLDQRDAIVDVPESLVSSLKDVPFEVSLQAFDAPPVKAMIREIAPQADPITRSRRIRMTLDNPPDAYRLGSIITARALEDEKMQISLPLSALLEEDGKTFVWVVDEENGTVAKRPVAIGGKTAHQFTVVDGVEPGARIVTAGVHTLKQGQKIALGEEKHS